MYVCMYVCNECMYVLLSGLLCVYSVCVWCVCVCVSVSVSVRHVFDSAASGHCSADGAVGVSEVKVKPIELRFLDMSKYGIS